MTPGRGSAGAGAGARWCGALLGLLCACSEPASRERTLPSASASPAVTAAPRVTPGPRVAAADAAVAPADPGAALDVDPRVGVPGVLEDPSGVALLPLYRALALLDSGTAARVGIVQLGDSLTAGDFQTSVMRQRLQARFGDAGRGWLLPGKPIKHYYLGDAQYGTEGKWDVEYGMKRTAVEPVGLGGVRIHSGSTKVSSWVSTCSRCNAGKTASHIELWYRRTPESGTLTFTVDDGTPEKLPMQLPRGAPPEGTQSHVIVVPDGAHKVTLRPLGDGVVDLFAVIMERGEPGIVLDAIGVVGAQATHLERWDWTWVGEQLARRAPSLVVLAYGTNEIDDDGLDLAKFEARLVELVRRIKVAVPDAAVLIQGPPDRGKRELGRKECEKVEKKGKQGKGKGKGKGKRLSKRERERERERVEVMLPAGVVRPGCEWKTAAPLPGIIAAERRAAERSGAAFYDVFTAMGGADRSDLLLHQEPKWFYKDHVHFATAGGTFVAAHLLEDLMARYEAWRVRRGLPAPLRSANPPWPPVPVLPTAPMPTVPPPATPATPAPPAAAKAR